jgi:hypothetical protein
MSAPPDLAYLLIGVSTDPDTTRRIELVAPITCLGRPAPGEHGSDYVDLELPNVSRKHARIVRDGAAYRLENWKGRLGIGLYERRLEVAQVHELRHCDRFRIPDGDGPHIRLIFLLVDQTRVLPFEVESQRPNLRIFGADVKCSPLEYRLLAYLQRRAGELCRYDELIAHLWPDSVGRKEQLEVLLSEVRKKIQAASGGFTFMQVFRGEGICLML